MGSKVDVTLVDNENAVGTVSGGWWPLGLFLSTILVLLASSKTAAEYISPENNDIIILTSLGIMAMLVSAPYIHYRIKGGQFTRLPPRYKHTAKYHSTMNRKNQTSN